MIEMSQLNEVQLITFGLILLRMIAFVFSAAVLSLPSIPVLAKVLLPVVLTMMAYSTVAQNSVLARVADLQHQLVVLAFLEIVMGLCLGFLTRLFFFAVSMVGEMTAVSLGIGQAQIFNPLMGSQGNALEQFLMMFATLVFFTIGGHHMMIHGLLESYTSVPLAQVSFNTLTLRDVAYGAQGLFVIAMQLAAPIVISMIIVQFAVGLLSRAVPQINVISTVSAASALIGIVLLMICLPLMSSQMGVAIMETSASFFKFVKGI